MVGEPVDEFSGGAFRRLLVRKVADAVETHPPVRCPHMLA
jgi:hypothetical protein